MLYARTDKQNIGRCQTLLEHSQNVAMIAGYLGRKVGLERTSYLMGYTHDAGKGEKTSKTTLWLLKNSSGF